ncbi:MAG: hypothetical protein QNJ49_16625 [Mastigocoleus sp. MO_167.B18]|nr:hypothetical protein [Mastigocoleus sp. MO_167.B18]
MNRGFFKVPPKNGSDQIDISQDKKYTFRPEDAPIIRTQGLSYGAGSDQLDDLNNDTDALLAVGNVDRDNFVAVINSIDIDSTGGERKFKADVDYYGWDSYSWSLSDFNNRKNAFFGASGIAPITFGQVWALQQYGYGRPASVSFRIKETLSSPTA